MNMIMMLMMFTLIAFVSIILMCLFKGKMPPKIWNIAFIIADLVVYLCWNLAAFERGWLDEGWMTLENISPLACTLVPITLVLSDKVRQYVYDFLAFLSIGLFAAMLISQIGGPDGELGAATRYLNQRYGMPYNEVVGILTDIGTEENYCAFQK